MDKYRPCPSIIAMFTSDSQHPPRSKHAVYLGAIGAVCSGSTFFACILKIASNVRQLFAEDNFSRQHFQMHFFGALRDKTYVQCF